MHLFAYAYSRGSKIHEWENSSLGYNRNILTDTQAALCYRKKRHNTCLHLIYSFMCFGGIKFAKSTWIIDRGCLFFCRVLFFFFVNKTRLRIGNYWKNKINATVWKLNFHSFVIWSTLFFLLGESHLTWNLRKHCGLLAILYYIWFFHYCALKILVINQVIKIDTLMR